MPGIGSVTPFAHSAFRYDSEAAYVGLLAPFLCEALEKDQAAAVAVAPERAAALRRALGPDAGRIRFLDAAGWYVRPVRTIAAWAELVRGSDRPLTRIVNEVPRPADRWLRCEAALNAGLARFGVHVVCPYERDDLSPDVRRAHRLLYDDGWHVCDDYREPAELLALLPDPPAPAGGRAPVVDLPIGRTVADLRAAVRSRVTTGGWLPPDRIETLILAVSELATNAIRHGGTGRDLRVWLTASAVVCEVSDDGPDPPGPLTGWIPPVPAEGGGLGLWLIGQLGDALTVGPPNGRTRIRFALPRD